MLIEISKKQALSKQHNLKGAESLSSYLIINNMIKCRLLIIDEDQFFSGTNSLPEETDSLELANYLFIEKTPNMSTSMKAGFIHAEEPKEGEQFLIAKVHDFYDIKIDKKGIYEGIFIPMPKHLILDHMDLNYLLNRYFAVSHYHSTWNGVIMEDIYDDLFDTVPGQFFVHKVLTSQDVVTYSIKREGPRVNDREIYF